MTNHTGLPWHIVEAAINREKEWLLKTMDFGQAREILHNNAPTLSTAIPVDEMLRNISISIVRGDILARQYTSKEINGLWTDNSEKWELGHDSERHGGEWHRAMMALVKKYFLEENYEVTNEPFLAHGRADLGVYKEKYPNVYIEVGSTSLYKTWINLHSSPNSIFLYIPTVYSTLEFTTQNRMALSSII